MINSMPRWMLVGISSLFMLIMSALITGAYVDIDRTKLESSAAKIRIEYLEKRFDRFEDKLDRIGDRLGVKV